MFFSNPYSSSHSFNQRAHGSGMIEIIVGVILFAIVACLGLDLYLILQGAILNDALVESAARAAAMGQPAKLAPGRNRIVLEKQLPYKRVMAIIDDRRTTWPSLFDLAPDINITETINPPVPVAPLGGPVSGSITVGTTIIVHPKFIFSLFKMDSISLTASKTYPYTWVMKSEVTL